jgi:hypothetical protein
MRRNASTVVVLPGPVPAEVLAAVGRSMNALVTADPLAAVAAGPEAGDHGPDFYLGPLRSVRSHRVAVVVATEPAQQAAGVLQALGSLRHGPWWPGLDEVIEAARTFYPDSLAEGTAAAG